MSKKKKEKIIYYDDNSTIADMSGLPNRKPAQKPKQATFIDTPRKSGFGDKWRTYWSSVKMMFLPMIVVLFVITLIFLGMMWLGGNL